MKAAEIAALKTGDPLVRTLADGTDVFGIVEEKGAREVHVRWEGGATGILNTAKDYDDIQRRTP